ncbi:MAG TPA: PLP-dependent aspartate aminotransferase family protein [Candidatus Sulfotelmatobacter sp.]|jgi:cystathionine gamma-lyase/cystathionine beta-lyase/cystathionine gamma-lyase/homocysteine desulfhydrase|nr:PLP-dependent aspartate aminotransferase family protein [Candidatus Sulfotelmatobacter sp.]
MKKDKELGFATRAIHLGQEPDAQTGAVTVPIYPTSTYVQQGIGEHKGYEYSRVSNPTRTRLEANLAALEGGVAAPVFASGMAAISAVMSMLKSGDHVVCSNDLYGGSPRLFNQVMAGFGVEFSYVDTSDARNVERAIRKNTRMVYVETPTNPLMHLTDLAAVSAICRRKKVSLVVDNTFMSPYFQQPLALGADMVVHSTTKFLNGHSDGLGGVVVCAKQEHAEKLAFLQKAVGAILSPFECWLVLRGVKTLAARMEIHDRSGRIVGDFLSKHKKVKAVFYPGLTDHPQHALAKRQMTGFGAMITFETGSLKNANKMLKKVRVCSLGESLGGVETLISHPATMTHAGLGAKGRKALGITDGMVRISVGIEDVDDILDDLDAALNAI